MIKQKKPGQLEPVLRLLQRDNNSARWISRPFKEAIALLSSFSLINVDGGNGQISMHPLVHAWAQDR